MGNTKIIDVKNLKTYFKTDDGIVKAVDDVSFSVKRGKTLGIVGESGSGKSVMNLSIMRLIPSPPGKIEGGEIFFNGEDILKMSKEEVRKIRGNKISMIFQDPMTSLNPFLRISTQMVETIMLHQGLSKKESKEKAIDMLKKVGIPLPEKKVNCYPHQFSGGMRQRVMIAMALSCNPELLIADEPTTALDVTIQAQILELMKELTAEFSAAQILITHDLGVVAGICHNINVMYAGRIVEKAPVDELFGDPKHPYTQGLIKSVPRLDRKTTGKLYSIKGQPPNLINLPVCCPFYPRCEYVKDVCRVKYPGVTKLSENREVNCWLYSNREA